MSTNDIQVRVNTEPLLKIIREAGVRRWVPYQEIVDSYYLLPFRWSADATLAALVRDGRVVRMVPRHLSHYAEVPDRDCYFCINSVNT